MYNQRSVKYSIEQEVRAIPIIKAIDDGDIVKLRRLISNGEDINVHVPGGGKTPLHIACERSNLAFVRELISAGADVNGQTKSGFTPLHVAAKLGETKIAEELCKNPRININLSSAVGCTPLHEAAAQGHLQVTMILLKFKADPSIKDARHNLTAANLANIAGHEKVRDLITKNMTYQQSFVQNINNILFIAKSTCVGNTPAHKFISKVSKLLFGMEDADAVYKIISTHLASSEYKRLAILLHEVRVLLIKNMDLYNQDQQMHQAKEASFLQSPLQDSLTAKQLQRTLRFFMGEDENSLPKVEVALRRAAAGLRPADDRGMAEQTIILKYLISVSENINACSPSNGMTALHFAVTKGQIENIKLLLAYGADSALLDHQKKTAADYALDSSIPEIKLLFASHLDDETLKNIGKRSKYNKF